MERLISAQELNLDSSVQLLKMAYSFQNWERIIGLADELHKSVTSIYEKQQLQRATNKTIANIHIKRPLVYYYGYSWLMKGLALKSLQRYDKARECILKYAELGWFNGLDPEGEEEVDYYRFISTANIHELDLISGKVDVLDDYVQFLKDNPLEILPGLITILETANCHNINVDDTLRTFKEQIEYFGNYEDLVNVSYYHSYLYELATYEKVLGRIDVAVNTILELLVSSIKIGNDNDFKKSVILFESMRESALQSQVDSYKNILNTMTSEVLVQ